jgi:hypothetical protein
MPVRRFVFSLVIALVVAATGLPGRASGPSFWVSATQADFLKGQSDGVSVDDLGRLAAGPALANVADLATPQVWSLAVTTDGTWYAGTGADGRVVRGRGAQTDVVLHAAEVNIHAIVAAPDGRVFAGSSPDGKVYVIERDGSSRVFFDPAERYIWALLLDRTGRLWVGTGNPAAVYRVDPDGKSTLVYKPAAAHVVSLALDRDGRVLLGTDSPGRVYRLDASDRPFALLETGSAEVHAMQVAADGSIYAVALSSSETSNALGDAAASTAPSSASSSASVSTSISAGAFSTPGSSSPSTPKKSVLYRIAADGSWDALWDTADTIYDVALAGDGTVIVSTGPDGRVYRVGPNHSAILLSTTDAKQLTHVVRSGDRYLLAAANPGRVLSLSATTSGAGTYISAVRDARSVAAWGTLRWEAIGAIAISTRSGNTDKPDESWSDWSGPYAHRDGDAIQSPAARYLQWKAVFSGGPSTGTTPLLTSVTIAYLPKNTRPTVTAITVQPPGVIFQRPYVSDDTAVAGLDDSVRRPGQVDAGPSMPGRRMYQKGLQTLQWKADDDDNDRLIYTLQYRREGDTDWHDLRAGLTDPVYVWDTTTVPDGRYVVKVLASDAPSNTTDRALIGDRESDAFDIDNTPPVITTTVDRTGGAIRVSVTVRDAQSVIDRVDYAMGGGTWAQIYPIDGVADSRTERYQIIVKSEAELEKLIVRASDVLQNVTSQPVVVR